MSTPEQDRLLAARTQFAPAVSYLDSATMGLPSAGTLAALRQAESDWSAGVASADSYDRALTCARTTYAGLVNVAPAQVAVSSQVSVFVGLVAAALPDGAQVLCAEQEFTSLTFPFLAQAGRGVVVREVPLAALPDAVSAGTTMVAVSAVQSADGRLADLDALVTSCAATGARVLLDTTQAVGWLPIDASRFAYTTGGGYKWLLSPRGTAYLTLGDGAEDLTPINAGWYAGADPWASIYGGPLRLAGDARRFDVSPAWLPWVGAAPALELIAGVGSATLHAHSLRLAERFCAALDLPSPGSAIVSVPAADDAPQRLSDAGVRTSLRAGRVRLAFHLYNDDDDVDRAVAALRGHLRLG